MAFLDLANYYGRFIQNFVEICAPLYDSIKKENNNKFVWNGKCEKHFNISKSKLIK